MIFTKLLHKIEFCYEIQKSDDNDEFRIMMMKKIFSNIKQHQTFTDFPSPAVETQMARIWKIFISNLLDYWHVISVIK